MSTQDRWPDADGVGPHPALGSTCQTGPPLDSHVGCSRKAQEQKRAGLGGKSGKAEAGPGQCVCVGTGRRGCSGPDVWVCKHLASPHCGWALPPGNSQSRRGDRQQVQDVPSEVAYDRYGRSFLIIVPGGTPSSKEPPAELHIPEASSHCPKHSRLLSRSASLGF